MGAQHHQIAGGDLSLLRNEFRDAVALALQKDRLDLHTLVAQLCRSLVQQCLSCGQELGRTFWM